LKAYPAEKKVTVIKVIREITGLGLMEALYGVVGARSRVMVSASMAVWYIFMKQLEEVGATVVLI
jgi:large subunit ribosomal protein L7/L12